MLIIAACIAAIVSAVCMILVVGLLKQAVNELSELKKAFFQFRGSVNTIIRSQREVVETSEEIQENAVAQDLLRPQNGV
jgi:uncharacterized protein YoxC